MFDILFLLGQRWSILETSSGWCGWMVWTRCWAGPWGAQLDTPLSPCKLLHFLSFWVFEISLVFFSLFFHCVSGCEECGMCGVGPWVFLEFYSLVILLLPQTNLYCNVFIPLSQCQCTGGLRVSYTYARVLSLIPTGLPMASKRLHTRSGLNRYCTPYFTVRCPN